MHVDRYEALSEKRYPRSNIVYRHIPYESCHKLGWGWVGGYPISGGFHPDV